jgi:hypothetical protein
VGRGVGEHDEELIATESANRVVDAQVALNDAGDGDDGQIALGVSEDVIDRLEVIDVDESYGKRYMGALGALHLGAQNPFGAAAIEGRGEEVADGLVVELADELSVQDEEEKLTGGGEENESDEEGERLLALGLEDDGAYGVRDGVPGIDEADQGKAEHQDAEGAEMTTPVVTEEFDSNGETKEEGDEVGDDNAGAVRVDDDGEEDGENEG